MAKQIELRGVEVHNLKKVDLDLPHRQLIAFCGVSGSGKTSLALDTLYAEGQRRYIESFSVYTRQFLERLEKPAAERIDGLPAALAVARESTSRSGRSTIGTTTETNDYLRLLYAKIAKLFCRNCGQPVARETPESAAQRLEALPAGTKFLLTFQPSIGTGEDWSQNESSLREQGFVRIIAAGKTMELGAASLPVDSTIAKSGIDVVVDRLAAGSASGQRLRDSLETAFAHGGGVCFALVESNDDGAEQIDGRTWQRIGFSADLRCLACGIEYAAPEPRRFSFNSPLGACPQCEGFGNTVEEDPALIVPDTSKTLRDGAVAPWNTPAYAHELTELLALAKDYELPVDVPYRDLTEPQRKLVWEGVPERNFGGLRGFFQWLEKRKYKMHLRVHLSRWRTPAHVQPVPRLAIE